MYFIKNSAKTNLKKNVIKKLVLEMKTNSHQYIGMVSMTLYIKYITVLLKPIGTSIEVCKLTESMNLLSFNHISWWEVCRQNSDPIHV